MRRYLLTSVANFDKPDDQGIDPEAARKAAVQAERDKVKVTSVKIDEVKDDEPETELETKEDDKDDEQKDESSEEETEDKGEEKEDDETDDKSSDEKKLELKQEKKIERLEKKIAREAQKRREAEKELAALKKKAEGTETTLTEDDVEKRSEAKAQEKQLLKEFNAAVDKLADGAQKHLKMKTKEFDELAKEVTEELGAIPSQIIGILDDLDNGPIVLAHLFKNVDEAEEIYKLKDRPAKLGLELAKLSTKLATPKPKKISQVPDPIEPLGGKPVQSDRLAFLMNKKNKTQEEMNEWVHLRNAEVASKRTNGRMGLR